MSVLKVKSVSYKAMLHDKEVEIRLQFLEEAQEYLNTIESIVLELSATGSHENMDAVLRAAHSIKGGAAMMGFQTLSDLAHRLEDFFKVLKTYPIPIDTELENLLLSGVDHLRSCITLNRQGTDADEQWLETHINPVFDQLYQLLGNPTLEDTAPLTLPEDEQDMVAMIFETEVEGCLQRLESVLANPEKPCLLEEVSIMAQELGGLGEMLELTAFKDLCESITQHLEASPERVEEIAPIALQEWRRSQAALLLGQGDALPTQIDLGSVEHPIETEGMLEGLLHQLEEADLDTRHAAFKDDEQEIPLLVDAVQDEPVEILPLEHRNDIQASELKTVPSVLSEFNLESSPLTELEETQDNTVRVPLRQLEQLSDLFGEVTIGHSGMGLYVKRMLNQVKVLKQQVRKLQRLDTRREMETDSNLHELSSEVIETIVRIQEATDDISLSLEDTNQTVSQLNRTAKQLQTTITQVRMRPLSDLVGIFPRFVRKLSEQYGKDVGLKLDGDETLIDRTILEAIRDPLVHLVRNAFDHGIENSATRRVLGKPEQGVIKIKAAHRGNQTLITVSDDGGGIDLDRVRRQAMHLGLDAPAIAAASDEELLTLIFEPGFSTAGQVTALSGRGVGMDVVRTNIRKIRGDIKVDTQLGVGTTFTLSVPLTLSVARVLLVESNGMLLAFPTDAIKEMLVLNPEDVFTIAGNEVLSWQGYMAPLIRLKNWLEIRCPHKVADSDTIPIMSTPTVLMIAQGSEWVGIQVDRCWGEQEVAIRQVEGAISMPPGFTGCTVLGDGRVVPLVNAPELLHSIASYKQSHSLDRHKPLTNVEQSQKGTILIVDDSINVRRFLGLTLEKAGYQVEQAKDGQDALEKLLNGLQIRAVICDIDMPRLNGYGLLARVKSNPTLKQLPVAMLTSRAGQKERQLAMNLGATAYFCKPYNEQELLQTIREIVQN